MVLELLITSVGIVVGGITSIAAAALMYFNFDLLISDAQRFIESEFDLLIKKLIATLLAAIVGFIIPFMGAEKLIDKLDSPYGVEKIKNQIINQEVHLNKESEASILKKIAFKFSFFKNLKKSNTAETNDEVTICNKLAEGINQISPIQIDNSILLKHTMCIASSDQKYRILFKYQVDSQQESSYKQESLDNNKKFITIKLWCSEAEQISILEKYNIEYKYYNKDEDYIGRIKISESDCVIPS